MSFERQAIPSTTQTRHPWRATVRTTLATVIPLLPLLPTIVHELGIDSLSWVAAFVAAVAAVTRVISIPQVNALLTNWLNLGATPKN